MDDIRNWPKPFSRWDRVQAMGRMQAQIRNFKLDNEKASAR